MAQVPSQAQSPTETDDNSDLSSFSKNLSITPHSPFSSVSIESLISDAAEILDRSVTPQASAKLDSQVACPRQLRFLNPAESLDRSVTPKASAKLDSQAACPRQLRSLNPGPL